MRNLYIYLPAIIISCFAALIINSTPHHQAGLPQKDLDQDAISTATAGNSPCNTESALVQSIPDISSSEIYPAENDTVKIGYPSLGLSSEKNTFTVNLPEKITENKIAWLEYDLFGLQDYSCAPHSINDNLAVGGYWRLKSGHWAHQYEKIPVRSLKQGKNIIRFTAPTEIDFKYMIKNLSIHIGENIYTSRQLVVNQPTTRYYYQRFGYVQGFVQGYQADEAIISVGGKQIPSFDGAFEYLVQKPESTGEKWTASIMATFPDGETIQSEITFIKSIDCDLLTEANSMSEKQIEHSEANGSFWLHLKGLSLNAPEASIPPNTQITAVTLRSIDFPMMDAGLVNVNENGGGYRCLPHGTKFSKEVLLSMEYDPSRLPSGYTPDDIKTYYFDNDKRRWIVLPRDTVDITNHLIISRTSHFTDFINGIIKTPESPLTQAYTPTSIKDIKAANPLEGMSVIEPPTANNTGSAKMTFPLVIPPGRKGIQPQLNLTYTSDGGNGWVGLGWNISLPSISVETRWGVPRYDPQQESETYCLNGEQLATKDTQGFYNKMPHRGDWVNRMGNNVNFYPRVEGAFDSIIRHGPNPKNYWWEVIDRNGVSSYYGKMHDSTKVDPSAVLTDDSGNIAYWALTETRDLFNNTVRYHYTVVLDPGNEGGSNYGKQIYISTINYTGHESDSGLFSVLFERYDTTVYKRNDIMISGKYGFKEVTGELLKKVSILFHGNMVRNYHFAFKQGVFGKTLLCGFYEQEVGDDDAIENITDPRSVCTYLNSAEAQNLIKVHRFDYYSDCYSPYTGYDLYEPQVSINTYNDNLANTGGSSAINQSKTDQWGLGGALTVGFGANPFLKNMTAGGYYNYNATQSKRLNVLMMDINGDGLPDKVFAKDGTMSYRKQYYDISSQQYKFDSTPTAIDGITDFLYQESESDAFGGQATFSVVSASYQHSTSKSTTSVYFSDVNGDGLPDLVQDDKVYFNTLNASGNPQFSLANNDTVYIQGSSCNYTVHNGAVIDTVLSYTAPNKPSMTEPIYIPFDAVRLWVAPYDGIINIDAPITLIQDTSLSRRMSKYVDGIRYTIQHNNTELWADTISKDNYNEKNSNNIALDSIVVNAGDKIFFRLQSRYNRSFDKVIWDPYISYDGCLVEYDANGLDFRRFQASSDFLLDQQRSYGAPVGGTMKVAGRIQIPELSDTVTIKIIQNTTDIYSYTHDGLSAVDDSVDFSFTVDSLDSIYCQIRANTNVDWKSISFQPHMYYISNTAGLPDTNDDGSRNLEYDPVLHRTIFNEPVFISFPYTLDQFNTSTIRPFLDFISDTIDGTVTFVVKSNNTTIVKQFMTVTNGQLNNPSWIDLELRPDQTVYFEFYSVDTSLMYQLTDAHIELDSSSVILPAGAHTVYPTSLLKFGPMYRGWGQFTYNCDTTESNQPIITSYLEYDNTMFNEDSMTNNPDTTSGYIGFINSFSGFYNPLNTKMILMNPDPVKNNYEDYTGLTSVSSDIMRNCRVTHDSISITLDDPIPIPTIPGKPARTVRKQTISDNYSFSVGWNPFSMSYSDGNSELKSDYFDVNGDRYPDIVGPQYTQLTTPQGGLSDQIVNHHQAIGARSNYSEYQSYGAAYGTTFMSASKTSSNSPRNAKFTTSRQGSTSFSAGYNEDQTKYSWQDVNGDGLPDKVNNSGDVCLNIGYNFLPVEHYGFSTIRTGSSYNVGFSGGTSYSLYNSSFSGGLGLGTSTNKTKEVLLDVNGDGLADRIVQNGSDIDFFINYGRGYASAPIGISNTDISKGVSFNRSINIGMTFGFVIPLPFISIKVCINPSANHGTSFNNEQVQISDMNGDGYPDMVTSYNEQTLTVRYSKIGRTNLLKSVDNYLGGSFVIDYNLSQNSLDIPQRIWTMSSLKVYDGFAEDGPEYSYYTFEYDSGYYSRFERQSFGFKSVSTHQYNSISVGDVYRSSIEKYHNTNNTFKNLKYSELTEDSQHLKFIKSTYTYKLKEIATGMVIPASNPDCYGAGYPALDQEDKYFYEGMSTCGIHTRKRYDHGPNGNVKVYYDDGDTSTSFDDIYANVYYHPDPFNKHIISTPDSIIVKYLSAVFRQRSSSIDYLTGAMTRVSLYNDTIASTYDLSYDTYGNLVQLVCPSNNNEERMSYRYVYDPTVMTYVHKIYDTLGYNSQMWYDPRFGKLLNSTDITGQTIYYSVCRQTKVHHFGA